MVNRVDISDSLTPEFFKNKDFAKGSVLIFESGDTRTELKIVRLNRSKRICEVVETKLYTEEDLNNLANKYKGGEEDEPTVDSDSKI